MIKKIGIGLSFIALAFFAFGVVQKGKIEENLTALLSNSGISVRHVSINLLPSPNVLLDSVQYANQQKQEIKAQQIRFNLPWFNVLRGDLRLQRVMLLNGELLVNRKIVLQKINAELGLDSLPLDAAAKWLSAYQHGSLLKWKHSPSFELSFSAQNAEQDEFMVNTKGRLYDKAIALAPSEFSVKFHQKRLFNSDKLELKTGKGNIDFNSGDSFSILIDGVQVNKNLILSSIVSQFSKTTFWQGHLDLIRSKQEKLNIQFSNYPQEDGYEIVLNGRNLNTKEWLDAFNIPALIIGNAHLNAHLWAENNVPVKGDVQAEIENGMINSLNLLELISQYVPLNYDEERIKSGTAGTTFDKVITDFTWTPERLLVRKTDIFHKHFIAHNDGVVGLKTGECDFHALLALNNPRYQSLKLPVHFFGDCQSPQYQVKFDRTFRHQLKGLLKEKLKE